MFECTFYKDIYNEIICYSYLHQLKLSCRIFVEQLSILVMYFGNSLTRPHSTYNIDDKVKCLVEFEICIIKQLN